MVIAPQVVTVADVGVLPDPWTRTQTFASRFEISIPRTAGVPRPFPITSAFIYGYHIAGVWVTGRVRQNRNLSLVLEGNTPRSPRMTIMPSTTMLTRGLTGTTGRSGLAATHLKSLHPPGQITPEPASTTSTREAGVQFPVPTEGQRSAHELLTRKLGDHNR